MVVYYSTTTINSNIAKLLGEIQNEREWATHYRMTGEVECLENCVRNIKNCAEQLEEWIIFLKNTDE